MRQLIKTHLARHWHHHLALYATAAAIAILLLGGTAAIITGAGRGGYKTGAMPPTVQLRGAPLPTSWWLGRFTTRIHNQGNSSSCVGQTLATIEEITNAERHHRYAYSSGFIYDLSNGGQDNGTSYQAAFSVLLNYGDPGLSVFPHDGIDWWAQPTSYAYSRAKPYRFSSWRSIDPSDRYTIEAELYAGRPIAIAIPVTDSFYQQWGDTSLPVITSQYGAYHFSHSITGIGYCTNGVLIQNSWGPTWGLGGRAVLSWQFLVDVGAEIVVSSPRVASRKSQVASLSPQLARIWRQYRAEHRLPAISYLNPHHQLTPAAAAWKARAHGSPATASRTGGIVSERHFTPRRWCRDRLAGVPAGCEPGRVHPPGRPYTEARFQGQLLVWWNGRPNWTPQWHTARWLR